jgi:hypothetical protein
VRDRWRNEKAIPDATAPLIDHVLRLMCDRSLPPVRREQWQRTASLMIANDRFVTLDEITEQLGSASSASSATRAGL